jgi:hypothetical protein
VREDLYRWGTPVEEFSPRVTDAVPVVSIHIEADVGNPKDFYFQASKEDVEYLISLLSAAKKELIAFEDYLGLSNQG